MVENTEVGESVSRRTVLRSGALVGAATLLPARALALASPEHVHDRTVVGAAADAAGKIVLLSHGNDGASVSSAKHTSGQATSRTAEADPADICELDPHILSDTHDRRRGRRRKRRARARHRTHTLRHAGRSRRRQPPARLDRGHRRVADRPCTRDNRRRAGADRTPDRAGTTRRSADQTGPTTVRIEVVHRIREPVGVTVQRHRARHLPEHDVTRGEHRQIRRVPPCPLPHQPRGRIDDRDWDDAHLVQVLRGVHADDPKFGYRLMSDEPAEAGHVASENRVHRLCREHEIWSTIVRNGRKSGKSPGPAVHDDLVMGNAQTLVGI